MDGLRKKRNFRNKIITQLCMVGDLPLASSLIRLQFLAPHFGSKQGKAGISARASRFQCSQVKQKISVHATVTDA